MKRTLLLIAISVIAFKSQAQTEASKFMLGGGAIFSSQKNNDNYKGRYFSIVPQAGYFVSKNLAIGAGIGYQYQTFEQNTNFNGNITQNENTQEAFVIAPFARRYTNITEQFRFFGQLSLPMSFGTTKGTDPTSGDYVKRTTERSFGAKLSPGFAFFPGGSKVSFEFSVDGLSYNHGTSTYSNFVPVNTYNHNKVSNDQFNLGANLLSPTISIYFYL